MYMPDPSDNVFGLTETEILFDRVTFERLLELIRTADKIVTSNRDCNSYGEFHFVTIVKDDHSLTAYGHGYHEYRERHLPYWSIGCDNASLYVDRPALSRQVVLTELHAEHADYTQLHDSPSKTGQLFSALADIGDEDGTLAMLQDFGML